MRLRQLLISAMAALLVVCALGCAGGVMVWTGAASPFHWRFPPEGPRFVLVHNGPSGPPCTMGHPTTGYPAIECDRPISRRGEFYAYYVTHGQGARQLVRFKLPDV